MASSETQPIKTLEGLWSWKPDAFDKPWDSPASGVNVQACHTKRQCLLGLMICQYVASPGLDLFQMKNIEWMAVELKCIQMKIVIFILGNDDFWLIFSRRNMNF